MKYELPKLPYSYGALEPYIDASQQKLLPHNLSVLSNFLHGETPVSPDPLPASISKIK